MSGAVQLAWHGSLGQNPGFWRRSQLSVLPSRCEAIPRDRVPLGRVGVARNQREPWRVWGGLGLMVLRRMEYRRNDLIAGLMALAVENPYRET